MSRLSTGDDVQRYHARLYGSGFGGSNLRMAWCEERRAETAGFLGGLGLELEVTFRTFLTVLPVLIC